MMVNLLRHVCVTRPQWVKSISICRIRVNDIQIFCISSKRSIQLDLISSIHSKFKRTFEPFFLLNACKRAARYYSCTIWCNHVKINVEDKVVVLVLCVCTCILWYTLDDISLAQCIIQLLLLRNLRENILTCEVWYGMSDRLWFKISNIISNRKVYLFTPTTQVAR